MDKLLEDIKAFFTDFVVTIKDLQSPAPIFVRDFYIRALLEFVVDDENVRKLQLTQSDVDPEEVEIIPELNLVTAVNAAFPFNDLGLLDLLIPDHKRTCQDIRNIMHFISFADERVSTLNPQMSIYLSMKEKINELKKQKDVYSQESNDLALERNDLVRSKKDVENSWNEFRTEVQLHAQETEEFISKKNLAIEKLKKKEMINLSLTQELEMIGRQIEELKNELVEHPEIDQNKLKEKENQLAKLRDKKEEANTRLKEKKNQKLKIKTVLEAVNEKLLPIFTLLVEEIIKTRGQEQQVINEEKEVKRLQSINEAVHQKMCDLRNEMLKEERRRVKLQEEGDLAETEIKKAIDEKESKYAEELAKLKSAKKTKKKLEDANTRVEELRKKNMESKQMFDELNGLLGNQEEGFEEFLSSFYHSLKINEKEYLAIKEQFSKLKEI